MSSFPTLYDPENPCVEYPKGQHSSLSSYQWDTAGKVTRTGPQPQRPQHQRQQQPPKPRNAAVYYDKDRYRAKRKDKRSNKVNLYIGDFASKLDHYVHEVRPFVESEMRLKRRGFLLLICLTFLVSFSLCKNNYC